MDLLHESAIVASAGVGGFGLDLNLQACKRRLGSESVGDDNVQFDGELNLRQAM